MLNKISLKLKKSRIYPIKKDENGQSARKRAFNAFDNGSRPSEMVKDLDISLRTACRYFEDWKKLPGDFKYRYETLKAIRNDTEFSDKIVETLANALGMTQKEVVERLHKPWGLKQLLMGEWPDYIRESKQSKEEMRLEAALKLTYYFEHSGASSEQIIQAIEKQIQLEKRG